MNIEALKQLMMNDVSVVQPVCMRLKQCHVKSTTTVNMSRLWCGAV